MSKNIPFSPWTWKHGLDRIKRPDGNHVEGTAGRLATCTPFENATMSGRLQDWPVEVCDDVSQYRLRRSDKPAPAPRFEPGWIEPSGYTIVLPSPARRRAELAGQRAYVVRSYDQVILVADTKTGRVVWTNPARYSMTTGGHQSAACEWTGHDLRHPECHNDNAHAHGDESASPSFARGGGQPSLGDRYRW